MLSPVLDPITESDATPPQEPGCALSRAAPSLRQQGIDSLLLSPGLHGLREGLACAVRLREPVLLLGEHGTGREALARSLHQASDDWHGSHGAFVIWTGGAEDIAADAPEGTLYVPDLDRLVPARQQTLLDWLRRVEATSWLPEGQRWRLIASAVRDPVELTVAGAFDDALLHQVDVLRIAVPPLRERPADAWLWAQRWLAEFNRRTGQRHALGPAARRAIETCAWPGNLPQLKACVLRAAAGCSDGCIASMPCAQARCLTRVAAKARRGGLAAPPADRSTEDPPAPDPSTALGAGGAESAQPPLARKNGALIDREVLINALERSGWVQAQAARRLNLSIRQVNYAASRYGIKMQRA